MTDAIDPPLPAATLRPPSRRTRDSMPEVTLHLGDCLDVLRGMPDASADACVTDPPYGLRFMGKRWDYDVPGEDVWREVYRVLKPGAILLSFGGARTYHRMVCPIEDAGFAIEDSIHWVYGSGFPKHKSKLKPAHEPIVLARKPGPKWLNVDGCRVPGAVDPAKFVGPSGGSTTEGWDRPWKHDPAKAAECRERQTAALEVARQKGRWPANLVMSHSIECGPGDCHASCPIRLMGEQGGERKSGGTTKHPHRRPQASRSEIYGNGDGLFDGDGPDGLVYSDSGSAARFFPNFDADPFRYCPKASRRDRGEGNTHPTVKPEGLMRWLCRLATPLGGTVLDPYMGSGSTGKAAVLEGFGFVGIDNDPESYETAQRRIADARPSQ